MLSIFLLVYDLHCLSVVIRIVFDIVAAYQVVVAFIVGSSVRNRTTTDFSASGEPFLMGTVAVGKHFKNFVTNHVFTIDS